MILCVSPMKMYFSEVNYRGSEIGISDGSAQFLDYTVLLGSLLWLAVILSLALKERNWISEEVSGRNWEGCHVQSCDKRQKPKEMV